MTRRRLILILATTAAFGALAFATALPTTRRKSPPALSPTSSARQPSCRVSIPSVFFPQTVDAMPGVNWGVRLGDACRCEPDAPRRHCDAARVGPQPRRLSRGGYGCTLDHGEGVAELATPPDDGKPVPALLPEIAGSALVALRDAATTRPRLIAPLPSPRSRRFARTRAVVVVKDGRIIAERYARWRRHRYAAARLLRDQVGDLGLDRHSRAQGQA